MFVYTNICRPIVSRETSSVIATVIEHLHLQSRAWGIELDSSQLALLSAYADLLVGYELANVIGVRNRDRIIVEHLVDALSCYVIEDFRLGR